MEFSLSHHWHKIQANLFPRLEEELGQATEQHRKLITAIELAGVENCLHIYRSRVGRPQDSRLNIANAFIAKAIYNLPTTRAVIDRLNCDPILRRICGWETKHEIPSEATFSRAFAEFAFTELASRTQEAFIKKHHSERIVGHLARDATAIFAREKAIVQPKEAPIVEVKKKGRPKKGGIRPAPEPKRLEKQLEMTLEEMLEDLPKRCDVGCKKNSKGFKETWKGYKLHIDTADGDIPIAAVLTSASVHDSQVALPLAKITEQRITNLYDLMDAAYDSKIIRDYSASQGRVALIDFNKRSPKDERQFLPFESERYKARSGAERVNSNLKDNFGGAFVRVKGHLKVMCHLMFGLLALTIEQSLRLLT